MTLDYTGKTHEFIGLIHRIHSLHKFSKPHSKLAEG